MADLQELLSELLSQPRRGEQMPSSDTDLGSRFIDNPIYKAIWGDSRDQLPSISPTSVSVDERRPEVAPIPSPVPSKLSVSPDEERSPVGIDLLSSLPQSKREALLKALLPVLGQPDDGPTRPQQTEVSDKAAPVEPVPSPSPSRLTYTPPPDLPATAGASRAVDMPPAVDNSAPASLPSWLTSAAAPRPLRDFVPPTAKVVNDDHPNQPVVVDDAPNLISPAVMPHIPKALQSRPQMPTRQQAGLPPAAQAGLPPKQVVNPATLSPSASAPAAQPKIAATVTTVSDSMRFSPMRQTPHPTGNSVVVSIPDKRVVVQNAKGQVVASYPVFVGTAAHPTPRGQFRIMENIKPGPSEWYYGGHWLGFASGYPEKNPTKGETPHAGFHGWVYDKEDDDMERDGWKKSTHGCVQMNNKDLSVFSTLVGAGDKVTIIGTPFAPPPPAAPPVQVKPIGGFGGFLGSILGGR